MAERPKAHDWKSCVPRKGTEGSNPSLCAKTPRKGCFFCTFFSVFKLKSIVLVIFIYSFWGQIGGKT